MEDAHLVLITPAKAQEFINRNKGNRSLRPGVVEKYAADMLAGNWTQCVAPIVFYEGGDVADGQHRLWAVIESGKSQKFYIVRDLPREAGLNIDTGLTRSLVDSAKISGADDHLSPSLLAWSVACELGVRSPPRALSNAERLELVSKHRAAGDWVVTNGPKGRLLRTGSICCAVMRAWYYEQDKAKLRRFCDVLTDGMQDGMLESAAVALRNYMHMRGAVATTSAMWRDTFFKAQNAIKYFMSGRSLTVCKSVKDEAYPLPGIHPARSAATKTKS